MRHPGPLRLRRGVNLRAYGQRDPLNEYKREAFELFEAMLANLRQHVTSVLSDVELRVEPAPMMAMAGGEPEEAMAEEARATGTTGRPAAIPPRAARRAGSGKAIDRAGPRLAASPSPWAHTPSNAHPPCGSGKKYKHCHGRV